MVSELDQNIQRDGEFVANTVPGPRIEPKTYRSKAKNITLRIKLNIALSATLFLNLVNHHIQLVISDQFRPHLSKVILM